MTLTWTSFSKWTT